MPTLDFWFEFASTYSYLTAMRIEQAAGQAGVALRWKPFLLGPIFKAQGWDTSPFNIYPEKGRYMVRDMERLAQARGLAFALPDPFPQQGVYAARLALVGADEGWAAAFTRAVFQAEFADGAQIGEESVLGDCLSAIGLDAEACLARAREQETKDRLRAQSKEAQALGIFGAPSFVTADGELFWGDDRLEQALAWAGKPG